MTSSRIFIRNLPPSLTQEEFKSHFTASFSLSDAKLIPHRRIGYVGYRTSEDAAKAVKHFNKSFIRLSRIAVELALPANDDSLKTRRRAHGQAHSKSSYPDQTTSSHDNPLKRKRGQHASDPKFTDYLDAMQPPSKQKSWADGVGQPIEASNLSINSPANELKDAVKARNAKDLSVKEGISRQPFIEAENSKAVGDNGEIVQASPREELGAFDIPQGSENIVLQESVISDSEWLRSRTRTDAESAIIESEESSASVSPPKAKGLQFDYDKRPGSPSGSVHAEKSPNAAVLGENGTEEVAGCSLDAIKQSSRLFLRNLPYSVVQEDLIDSFGQFGALQEVHIPLDSRTRASKGFAYVQYLKAEDAVSAFQRMDGTIFQGRLLHVLPASARNESKLDEFSVSKLPFKQQKLVQRRAEAGSRSFNWNSLYMNADAVLSSLSDRLGLDKSQILDPTSSDAAVKQAQAETHIIQETKAYFAANGVDLEAFQHREKCDSVILVKNFPYGTTIESLRQLFGAYGSISRLLMPPNGTIAIIEFAEASNARAAFKALAYRKIKDSILFLEKAPKNVFSGNVKASDIVLQVAAKDPDGPKSSATDLLQPNEPSDTMDTSTLFVRNLNFSTSNERLAEVFRPIKGFLSARVKTKIDPKKPSTPLSMGFGFIEFRSKSDAQAALEAMDGYCLDGHILVLKASHRGLDAAQEKRKDDQMKKAAGHRTKIIIKNLPFEASKKDIRALFGAYGQLRSVRVPKKFDSSTRGFAFADFTTPREAESAMDALRHTHLLGRRLVLEFAADDPQDAEEEIKKMQNKVGSQINKMALQKLTGSGRKKVNLVGDGETEEI